MVSRASFRDAVTANFGGEDSEFPGRAFTSAYMLVYIRKSAIGESLREREPSDEVLCPVTDDDIPPNLRQRFELEKTEEMRRKKEKSEAHLFTEIMVGDTFMETSQFLMDDVFAQHHGFDLFDYRLMDDDMRKEKVEKKMTMEQLYQFASSRVARNHSNNITVLSQFPSQCSIAVRNR